MEEVIRVLKPGRDRLKLGQVLLCNTELNLVLASFPCLNLLVVCSSTLRFHAYSFCMCERFCEEVCTHRLCICLGVLVK